MENKIYNVLFICTGNSARSIKAEVIMNHLGRERFKAYSAGSHPRGEVHPMTLEVLSEQCYDLGGLRSKSWTEFAEPDAPQMDFIMTVCDQAAGEACPAWPGQAHHSALGICRPHQDRRRPGKAAQGVLKRAVPDRQSHPAFREPAYRKNRPHVAANQAPRAGAAA
jgi:arsenate reductase